MATWRVMETAAGQLASQFERLRPAEMLLPKACPCRSSIATSPVQPAAADWQFDRRQRQRLLTEHFGTRRTWPASAPQHSGRGRAAALFDYARSTQRQSLAHITRTNVERESAFLRMDAATRRNLELTETTARRGRRRRCCRCSTAASPAWAAGWLRHALHHPLRDASGCRGHACGRSPSCW
jgi:DNA mismatch repair protein MutS